MATRVHNFLSHAEKAELRHLVEDAERETGAEIAVLIIRHVTDLEGFATAYFNHLGIGKRGHDNGVLILIVADRRLIRIEVGQGLEAAVTREAAQRIIGEVIAPELRAGRYGQGVLRGARAIVDLIRSTPGAPRGHPTPAGG